MKKCLILLVLALLMSGFGYSNNYEEENFNFSIEELYDYQKSFKSEEIKSCAYNRTKTYMDYRSTTAKTSKQYIFIHEKMTVDEKTGFLYDQDGFIGVALGSFYGQIGDRFYFTLESGVVLPLVKVEEKAEVDTDASGCYHISDSSVIEFVIDRYAAAEYFGNQGNGLVLNGNYNNYPLFSGQIVKVEKVLAEANDNYVSFSKLNSQTNEDLFYYAKGY